MVPKKLDYIPWLSDLTLKCYTKKSAGSILLFTGKQPFYSVYKTSKQKIFVSDHGY